ncbi:MAG TPA: hypothetical protein VG013_16535 [Gemmataceae bacterium]|nr:hypothetical protein [Gemmataceae bacterium]
MSHNAARLPRKVMWYADPAGAGDISELLHAGFTVRRGHNPICPGIAAVTARIQTGRLKILAGKCPNLLAEALLYRYDENPKGKNAETPVDEHNHALAALRYLVARIDKGKMARAARSTAEPAPADATAEGLPAPPPPPPPKPKPWLRYDNEELWTPLNY